MGGGRGPGPFSPTWVGFTAFDWLSAGQGCALLEADGFAHLVIHISLSRPWRALVMARAAFVGWGGRRVG